MNALEKISKNNMDNYNVYLQRMTNSFNTSSKQLIPTLVSGTKVLDVGCGSGILLEELKKYGIDADGIDLNSNAVKECKSKNLNAVNINLKDVTKKYDTVIFSSVLHEFSSYADVNRFGTEPIEEALKNAYNILNPNGHIIIRDGLKSNPGTTTVSAKNSEVIKTILKYKEDAPMFKDIDLIIDKNNITAESDFLKEFMFTYTWGPESYQREVNEKYGILTVSEWRTCIKNAGFNIKMLKVNEDNYTYFLLKHFNATPEFKKLLSECTILIDAFKK